MARKKVKIAWIAKESTRKATFKKRTSGLLKKVREMATLCDVKACAVVYGSHEPHPEEVWPSVPEAMPVLALFKSMPEMEQGRKMVNREGFLLQQLAKLQEQLRRLERDNREIHTTLLMHRALAFNNGHCIRRVITTIEEATSLAWMVERNVQLVQQRISSLETSTSTSTQLQQFASSDEQQQQLVKMDVQSDSMLALIASQQQLVNMDVQSDSMVAMIASQQQQEENNYHPWPLQYFDDDHFHQMPLMEAPQRQHNWFMDNGTTSNNWQPWNTTLYPTSNGNGFFGGEEELIMQQQQQYHHHYLLDYDGTSACPLLIPSSLSTDQ